MTAVRVAARRTSASTLSRPYLRACARRCAASIDDQQSCAKARRSCRHRWCRRRWFVTDNAGSIAWIAVQHRTDQGSAVVVFKSDRTRGAERLDSGTTIDAHSLRRHGKMISWRHGSETRTARFVR